MELSLAASIRRISNLILAIKFFTTGTAINNLRQVFSSQGVPKVIVPEMSFSFLLLHMRTFVMI